MLAPKQTIDQEPFSFFISTLLFIHLQRQVWPLFQIFSLYVAGDHLAAINDSTALGLVTSSPIVQRELRAFYTTCQLNVLILGTIKVKSFNIKPLQTSPCLCSSTRKELFRLSYPQTSGDIHGCQATSRQAESPRASLGNSHYPYWPSVLQAYILYWFYQHPYQISISREGLTLIVSHIMRLKYKTRCWIIN